jgi:hypothetical protein
MSDRLLILAALRARGTHSVEQMADIEAAIDELAFCGYRLVKPSTLELEAPAQLRGCLRVAHQAIAGGHGELALEKIDVGLCLVRMLEDYLRELTRLGTQVPITWKEFVESQFHKNLLANSTACGNEEGKESS